MGKWPGYLKPAHGCEANLHAKKKKQMKSQKIAKSNIFFCKYLEMKHSSKIKLSIQWQYFLSRSQHDDSQWVWWCTHTSILRKIYLMNTHTHLCFILWHFFFSFSLFLNCFLFCQLSFAYALCVRVSVLFQMSNRKIRSVELVLCNSFDLRVDWCLLKWWCLKNIKATGIDLRSYY